MKTLTQCLEEVRAEMTPREDKFEEAVADAQDMIKALRESKFNTTLDLLGAFLALRIISIHTVAALFIEVGRRLERKLAAQTAEALVGTPAETQV